MRSSDDMLHNGLGGMAIGVALVWWIVLAMLSAAEYEKPTGFGKIKFLAWCLAPLLASMGVCGGAAAYFFKQDYGLRLLFSSPFIAGLSFVAGAFLGRK